MSQIEQEFRQFLSKKPELEMCYQEGLINRRAFARYLIRQGIAKSNQLEAVVAMLRRFEFRKYEREELELFRNIKVSTKDNIIVLDFEKDKRLMQELKKIIDSADYDKGETLKIVLGSSTITIFIDESNQDIIKYLTRGFRLKNKHRNISEISIIFPDGAVETKGIISYITKELYVNDILITEILTASPELLIYLKEEFVLKAYEVIKGLKAA